MSADEACDVEAYEAPAAPPREDLERWRRAGVAMANELRAWAERDPDERLKWRNVWAGEDGTNRGVRLDISGREK